MKIPLTVLAILIFITAYGQNQKYKKVLKSNFINIRNLTVFEFLEVLKLEQINSKEPIRTLTVGGIQTTTDWVKANEIDSLISLMSSIEPAKCITSPLSPYVELIENSTIGGQVIVILEAYKNGREYPFNLTICGKIDKARIAEIKQWWKQEKNRNRDLR
ncbi:hypothetical protein [Pedobacter arcticus]|uniref:hypothetical protein n=1 Tax=Pedobacter arcticus TaxID=752140 RepID=UPI0002F1FA96|nr:hypothetical protein [Pedobacter arcticus]